MKKNSYVLFLIFIMFCSTNLDPESIIEEKNTAQPLLEETSYYLNEKNIPIKNDLYHNELENCINFLGSLHKVRCASPYSVIRTVKFESAAVNTFIDGDIVYIVLKKGEIYEYNLSTESKKLVYSNSNVLDLQEAGLLSLAINSSKDYFAVSYVTKNFQLVVDKYSFNNSLSNNDYVGRLFSQDVSKPYTHIAGNLIWSEYYNTFLLSIGDNQEANEFSRINPAPLDTTTYLGKIIALENVELDVPRISKDTSDSINNIIGYGLRNPWQFFEFRNQLIVFDVGLSINEEMSISNLEDAPISYGWPIYEGGSLAAEIDGIDNYKIDINYFEGLKKLDNKATLSKLTNESLKPKLFYSHYPTENDYRAAIIGGDIFVDNSSEFNLNIVFADITTNEIFLYNLLNGNLLISPPFENIGAITTIKTINNQSFNTVVTTYSGDLVFLKIEN